jgi:hypothetical protein
MIVLNYEHKLIIKLSMLIILILGQLLKLIIDINLKKINLFSMYY